MTLLKVGEHRIDTPKSGEAEGDEGLEAGGREREREREREEGLRTDPGCWLGTNQG